MTITEQLRKQGFLANLKFRGRSMKTDTNEPVTVLVRNAAVIPDPMTPARAQLPVYVVITALSNSVKDPKAIKRFTEGNKNYTVMAYDEKAGERVTWSWECEAQRE